MSVFNEFGTQTIAFLEDFSRTRMGVIVDSKFLQHSSSVRANERKEFAYKNLTLYTSPGSTDLPVDSCISHVVPDRCRKIVIIG